MARNFDTIELTKFMKNSSCYSYDAADVLFASGTRRDGIYVVDKGWVYRYRLDEDGRRSITRIILPSEYIGLQSVVYGRTNAIVAALTACTVRLFAPTQVFQTAVEHKDFGGRLLAAAAHHEQAWEDKVHTLSRRTAEQRLCWFALDILDRAYTAGIGCENSTQTPLTQTLLADCLGLSLVHVNKSLAKLLQARKLNWHRGLLEIYDRGGIEAIAAGDGNAMKNG